jgi:hypothetical protein
MDRSEMLAVSGSYLLQTAQADSFGTLTRSKEGRRDSIATITSSCSDVYGASPLVFHPISGKPNLTISTSFEEETEEDCMSSTLVTHTLFAHNHDIEGRYARPNIFAQLMLEYEKNHEHADQKALTTSPCREEHDSTFPGSSTMKAHKKQKGETSASFILAKKGSKAGASVRALLMMGARMMSCLWTKIKIVPED